MCVKFHITVQGQIRPRLLNPKSVLHGLYLIDRFSSVVGLIDFLLLGLPVCIRARIIHGFYYHIER